MLVGTTTPVMNLCGFGRAIVVRLTRMNVKYSNGSDEFQILAGQLLRKQNARSNHHNGLRSVSLELTQSIKDTHVGLAAASREHTDAFEMLGKGIQSSLLVRAELNHGSLLNMEIL
jgi:peptidyl-tRNA hydrolase